MTTDITRVAILGGGPAGVAAAFELTATAELRERYHVTIYQPGWRLGGKCASGRNAEQHQRIEEHGLHVLFGFYDNMFDMLQRVYTELHRPARSPLSTWQKAVTPSNDLVFFDDYDDSWSKHVISLPPNDLTPGSGATVPLAQAVSKMVAGLTEWITALTQPHHEHAATASPPHGGGVLNRIGRIVADHVHDWLHDATEVAEGEVEREVARVLSFELHRLECSPTGIGGDFFTDTAHALRVVRDLLWKLWLERHQHDADIRFVFTSLDLAGTMLSGIIDDHLFENGFFSVEGEELRAWLRRHGALDITVDHSPIIRGIYDLTFAYEGGDLSKPNLAAGAALAALVRIGLTYKGSVTYKMNAGMGDTVFAPLFQVLTARGVDIKMFHWVDELGLADDRDIVDTISVFEQVKVAADYPYLVDVGGLPCWPSAPSWDHIVRGNTLQKFDLEQVANPRKVKPTVLRRGVDFDEVVLAVSPGGLGPITGQLRERSPRFAAMLDSVPTVATRAVQVWTKPTAASLGWTPAESSVATTFVEPLDTYCDMSHLIPREQFPARAVGSIGYFCGPTLDTDTPAAVHDQMVDFLEHDVHTLWPASSAQGAFDWNVLVDTSGAAGAKRFDAQYWRANTQGTERYVLSPAGSLRDRLRPDESGFSNLRLAGDWTRNGIDGGAVEAAVASGRLASKAICGSPAVVYGQDGPLVDSGATAGAPAYVDFGGLDTFPGPYDCKNTTLYSFAVQADPVKLAALVDRVLSRPTLGDMNFQPLGSFVMLSIGDIANVVPQTPPYNTYGSVNEQQLAVWVPVVQVQHTLTGRVPVAFWMFTSYIWVDNAMSMATGREMYGWPKSLGIITLPTTKSRSLRLDTYGLDFGRGKQPSMAPLLELTPTTTAVRKRATSGHTVADFVKALVDQMKALHGIDPLQGLGRDFVLADDAIEMALPEIYLKQFRSIECGTDAALQQVCESRARVDTITFSQLPTTYRLAIQHIDSHPLAADLGIADQEVKVGFKIEMDFLQDVGYVLWDSARRPSAQ